ncbi:uncharacterized protein LOC6576439 [Drosophila mojavensis]|uniref:Uncharacterized protein n=1 Tax=Drosophila mojavensis TaxID=7230 RepID=B4KEJ2_DROMO|nr:uncharacterized protein LOC6576439 [Drosophila mojavensis]EDW11871.1 uncharacterized protein Dmoj_GI12825 [Drosophila mojavensis]
MSVLSTRRTEYSGRRSTRKSLTTSTSGSYEIFCVNFYDNGLRAVRDEYINQIKLGLRQFLFVIDLDGELEDNRLANRRRTRASGKGRQSELLTTDPVTHTLLRIQSCLREYEFITRKIEAELSFNMLKYYQKNMPAQLKIRSPDSKKEKPAESKRSAKSKDTDTVSLAKITCFSVTAKEHHKVGKGQPLSKRRYIKDAPANTTIIIVIIGTIKNDFYKTLLVMNQPLRGIVHFLPKECAYDVLVPRPRIEKERRETIEMIQADIYKLRKRVSSKPVGIMQQQLPQMSMCQAARYSKNIFDQLTWFLYDMKVLREQYDEYYVKPYCQIDVKMSPGTSMLDSFQLADSLSIQGHYLKAEMPAVHDDDASVYLYVESLMCTFGNPRDLMTEMEVLMLANPTSNLYTKTLDKIKVYSNAFKSIIKLMKNELLFVEEANTLLESVISYMDQSLMRNIYHACLEYNVLRRYFSSGYIIEKLYYTPYNGDGEPQHLPKFAQLYLTDDSVCQRIIQLVDEYDNYNIEEIQPNIRLFTFRRVLNEVFENEKQLVIPTRLCFRDFTLYEMQEFLRDLVTPQMFETAIDVKGEHPQSDYPSNFSLDIASDFEETNTTPYSCPPRKRYSIVQPNVFVRPKSLKAQRMMDTKKDVEKKETASKEKSPQLSRLRSKESFRVSTKSARNSTGRNSALRREVSKSNDSDKPTYIGLRPDHPMLKGYNLDDARQTINVKNSKYYFEEGLITLYEEKWNFRQMNKCLSLEIDKQTLFLTNELGRMDNVSPNIRFQTPNGISLRIKPNGDECAKAVVNYPNGLTLYCHDTHVENLWSGQQSELNESRRVYTPYGCVITFYTNNDMVMIMRYNGEVYRLYSTPEVVEEDEGVVEDDPSFINACSTQSTYSSYRPLPKCTAKKLSKPRNTSLTNRTVGGSDAKGRRSQEAGSTSSETLAARTAKLEARQMKLTQATALFASIDAEIKFLEFIMQLFNLTFKHLKLTTSLGSVVHVQGNEIRCGKPIRVTEWHDYYANESYAMRDDGLRMVWTHDSLRCYHSDGTLITTRTTSHWDQGIAEDDIDKQISSSSSHLTKKKQNDTDVDSDVGTIYINVPGGGSFIEPQVSNHSVQSTVKEEEIELIEEIEPEDMFVYDYSFTAYEPDEYLIENKYYAGTKFNFTHINKVDLKLETSIYSADDLQFRIYTLEESMRENMQDIEEETINDDTSSEPDPDEWTKYTGGKRTLKFPNQSAAVTIQAPNIQIDMLMDRLEIIANLRKFSCDDNTFVVRDSIQLKVDMQKGLTNAFQSWVEEFHQFIKCSCAKWRTVYFVEATLDDCRKKGIELMKTVPPMGSFNFCAGNFFIDPVELKPMAKKMETKLKFYDEDMLKFPRFPTKAETPNIPQFATVMSTRIFVEIPAQLAYTDRIHLFLDPFEKIKFRKLKHRFSEALIFHLHPHLRGLVHKEISNRSWRNYHLENKRRLFQEQQRLSLYVAMLRHKVYPNYFQFKDRYHYHVRNIDFFEFMSAKCTEKSQFERFSEAQQETKSMAASEKDQGQASKGPPLSKSRRKKCLCPKYLNSLT